jgi:hypothetical protein
VGGQRRDTSDLPPGKDPVPTVKEAVWAPAPVWMGAENLAPQSYGYQNQHGNIKDKR